MIFDITIYNFNINIFQWRKKETFYNIFERINLDKAEIINYFEINYK